MNRRICQKTGLALAQGPVAGYRIANASYGALNPEKRHDDGLRDDWSRWDTPGRTVDLAGTLDTAFRECLAWARMVPSRCPPATPMLIPGTRDGSRTRRVADG